MYNFEDVEKFLKDSNLWGTQCFDSRNIVGDPMENIYDKDGVYIDRCYRYDYIEVFGLNEEDFLKLEKAHEKIFE